MVHTYSLVHDDMPVLDDDSLRRGRKTVHVVYDEPTALLAGNALLTDSFSVLTDSGNLLSETQRSKMVLELSKASGSHGMLEGQMLDMYWTAKADYTKLDLDRIHLNKTGKLLGATCALGALSAESFSEEEVKTFQKIGELVGHSFQIIDDLLDESESSGKSSGKDKEQGKLTYLSLEPRESCIETSRVLTKEALSLLASLKLEDTSELESFFSLLLERKF